MTRYSEVSGAVIKLYPTIEQYGHGRLRPEVTSLRYNMTCINLKKN